MTPLLYCIIGALGGALLVLAIGALWRSRRRDSVALANARTVEDDVVKRLEAVDRLLRDEFSRNREEAGVAAKAQREELGASIDKQYYRNLETIAETKPSLESKCIVEIRRCLSLQPKARYRRRPSNGIRPSLFQ